MMDLDCIGSNPITATIFTPKPNIMRNLFEDAMYLFDMKLDQPTIFKSIADPSYELHVLPTLEHPYDELFINYPCGIRLLTYIIKDGDLLERDEMSGNHMDSNYFFETLKWFNENPKNYIDIVYNQELTVKSV